MVHNKTLIVLFLLFSSLFVYVYVHFFIHKAFVRIDVRSNVVTNFKIYWAGENQGYSEKRSAFVRINYVQKKYGFSLTDLRSIKKIRIDPADSRGKAAEVLIKRMVISQSGYSPIRFSTMDEFKRWIPLDGIQKIKRSGNGLFVIASGEDPKMEVSLYPQKESGFFLEFIRILFFIFLIGIFLRSIVALNEKNDFIPYLMLFAAALSMIMAIISRENAHPDEYVHLSAAEYYENHWLPPAVCTPGTEDTYSVYGVSRLNSLEIVYLIAGKFSRLFAFFPLDIYIRLRMFNVLLLFILVGLVFRTSAFRIASAPLLISPQIWYAFSYFNSDAFSLFLLFLIGYQVLIENSTFNRYLKASGSKYILIKGILFGLLFSLLFLLKKNFYIFILFLFLFFLWKFYLKKENLDIPSKSLSARLIVIASVALAIFCIRYVADITINGFNKSERILNCRENLASYIYKPSTPLKSKHPWISLKKRGVFSKEMFTKYRWARRSFKSAFGVYGYTTIAGSNLYYNLVKWLIFFFLFFTCFFILFKSTNHERILLLIVFICSIFLIGAAFWRAWVTILQPQGRYFLPLAAMVGFLFFHGQRYLNKIIFNILIMIMFLMSSYSFIFLGLMNIPKY